MTPHALVNGISRWLPPLMGLHPFTSRFSMLPWTRIEKTTTR
jgi:hypothetical protein